MEKRLLIIGLIFLFLFSSVAPISIGQDVKIPNNITQSSTHGNTLYVGGSGEGNYTKIQDAVDNASDGDTVFVYNGIYSDFFADNYACVCIKKSISLIGENREHTIINGSGYQRVIEIQSNNVVVSGFTIQNGGTPYSISYGCGVLLHIIMNIHIYNNIIQDNNYGISVESRCSEVYIYNNIFMNNGIALEGGGSDNKIFNNSIFQNNKGLYIPGDNYYIYNNFIFSNNISIDLYGFDNATIEHNNIKENMIGMRLWNIRAKIQENNFISNEEQIQLYISTSIIYISYFFYDRQSWQKNYWDDWKSTQPRPIKGEWSIYIEIFWFTHWYQFWIAKIPYYEYDNNPAQKPYDI